MKTVIITGGNRGLGYACAHSLALTRDWHILLACRKLTEAQAAADQLRQETHHTAIEAQALDLASLASINTFADQLDPSQRPPLGALVCNAGVQIVSGTQKTVDGFEMTFGVNHLGHYLLVNRLLAQMEAPARIVFVSSGTHDPLTKSGLPEPEYTDARTLAFPSERKEDPGITGRRRYTTSKLANLFASYELARHLEQQGREGITVNAFDPGMMPGTGLARDYPPLLRWA